MAQATQTQSVPVLAAEDMLTRLRAAVHPAATQQYFALYSSILGGTTTWSIAGTRYLTRQPSSTA